MTQCALYEMAYDKFVEFLEENSYKKTPERFIVLKKIIQIGGVFKIEMIFQELKKDKYQLSKATIYNTIHLLEKAGFVRRSWATIEPVYEFILFSNRKSICWVNEGMDIQEETDSQIEQEILNFIEKKCKKKICKAIFYTKEK